MGLRVLTEKKSVILLGLTIRQIELPGFRKRKQTQKRKTRPVGTRNFLLLGLLERPAVPV